MACMVAPNCQGTSAARIVRSHQVADQITQSLAEVTVHRYKLSATSRNFSTCEIPGKTFNGTIHKDSDCSDHTDGTESSGSLVCIHVIICVCVYIYTCIIYIYTNVYIIHIIIHVPCHLHPPCHPLKKNRLAQPTAGSPAVSAAHVERRGSDHLILVPKVLGYFKKN